MRLFKNFLILWSTLYGPSISYSLEPVSLIICAAEDQRWGKGIPSNISVSPSEFIALAYSRVYLLVNLTFCRALYIVGESEIFVSYSFTMVLNS